MCGGDEREVASIDRLGIGRLGMVAVRWIWSDLGLELVMAG